MPAVLRKQVTKEIILDPVARLKQLTEYGSSVEIDKSVPIKRYFRSGAEMERQARVYYQEGRLDNAFILYNKFATLFVEKLPKHPEYSKALPADKTKIKKLLKVAFPRAMELKEKLKKQYEKDKEELERNEREAAEQSREEEAKRLQRQKKLEGEHEAEKGAQSDRTQEQQAEELAAFLAGEGGVATGVVPMDTTPPSSGDVMNSGTSGPSDAEVMPVQPPPPATGEEQQIGQDVQTSQTGFQEPIQPVEPVQPSLQPTQSSEEYQWPQQDQEEKQSLRLTATNPDLAQVLPSAAIAATTTPLGGDYLPADSAINSSSSSSVVPSAPPPTYDQIVAGQATMNLQVGVVGGGAAGGVQTGYDPAYQQQMQAQTPPPGSAYFSPPYATPPPGPYSYQYGAPPPPVGGAVPPYGQQFSAPGPASSHTSYASTANWGSSSFDTTGSSSVPSQQEPFVVTVDRTTKPSSVSALSTSWGGMEGLRPVYFPADTASRFEEVASSNTRKNVETCGILAGKLSQNTLRVTHIIVPKQKGTSDSCETLNEEELFDVQDQYDLITLGWIHTHPSQTAFMSSVDLHCHCSYQIMLDEAIAIVCAPKYSQVGLYMLTEPHGLNFITSCEEEGFHSHPKEPPLYEDCKHVHSDSSSFIQIVDLR